MYLMGWIFMENKIQKYNKSTFPLMFTQDHCCLDGVSHDLLLGFFPLLRCELTHTSML